MASSGTHPTLSMDPMTSSVSILTMDSSSKSLARLRPCPRADDRRINDFSLVRMQRLVVVRMWTDTVVLLPALPVGVHVDHDTAKVRQMVEQLVPDVAGDIVALDD